MKKLKFIMLYISLFLIIGCKTTERIEYVHDTIRFDNIEYKYIHDSIYNDRYHTVYTKGDTVFVHDSITKLNYKYINDTVIRDSIIVKDNPIEIVKEKTKYSMLPIIIAIIMIGAYYLYNKFYKKK